MAEQTATDNSIETQADATPAGEGLPDWSGEGLGDTGNYDAFSDEALDSDPSVQSTVEPGKVGIGDEEVEAPADAAAAPPQPTDAPTEGTKLQGIEHDPRFKNLRRAQVQTANELKAERARAAQMEAALQQAATLLQGQAGPAQPEFDPFDPESVQRFIQSQIQAGLAQGTQQVRQTVRAEQQQEVLRASIDHAVDSFKAAHPEVADGSELDIAVAEVVRDLQTPEEGSRPDHSLFPVTVENLEVAYALAQNPDLYSAVQDLDLDPDDETLQIARDALANPALYEEFKAQPALLDSDEGIKVAYRRAGLVQQVQNLPGQVQQAAAQGVSRALPQQMRRSAHVETGGTGAPVGGAPGAKPSDDFDEVVAIHRAGQNSIFG